MSEQLSLKKCPMCYKEIDKQAKKCPYCQHWQSKIHQVFYHPSFAIIILIIPMVMYIALFKRLFPDSDSLANFASNKGNISISNTELKFGESKCGDHMAIVLGTIKNTSAITWNEPNFEIRFYDKDKKLIDSLQSRGDSYSFEIPANEAVPFTVSKTIHFSQNNYVSYDVKILSAKEKKNLPF